MITLIMQSCAISSKILPSFTLSAARCFAAWGFVAERTIRIIIRRIIRRILRRIIRRILRRIEEK